MIPPMMDIPHVDGCNCDYDCDQDGYFRCYIDPRCAELEEKLEASIAAMFGPCKKCAGGSGKAAKNEGNATEAARP